MGYTNYFTLKKDIPQETWDKIIKDCKKLYKNMPEHTDAVGGDIKDTLIINGCFAYKLPQFNSKMIHFNGGSCLVKNRIKQIDGWRDSAIKEEILGEDLGHETFDLRPTPIMRERFSVRDGFSLCKTARKPYDLMVKACLLICQNYLEKDIEISCDGEDEDWLPAIKFVAETLNYISPDMASKMIS